MVAVGCKTVRCKVLSCKELNCKVVGCKGVVITELNYRNVIRKRDRDTKETKEKIPRK